jgi:exodeoxyribonuclease V alpha subunit
LILKRFDEVFMSEMIEGIVSGVVFSNAENGYTVLRLDTIDGVVTAAGSLPGVSQGERLILSGAWVTHPQYGEQFKTESFEVKPPSGADDIFRYLASGVIKNIGPAKARDIVEKFGSNALEIIENEPDKLASIKGISLRSARKLGEDYRRRAGLRRLIEFFTPYGIKPLIATRVYKDYGDDSLDFVRENPYIIASEAYGAEFFEADSVALDLGFESDCPERLSAALVFELVHNLGNGHVFIPRDKLIAAAGELVGVEREAVDEALDALCEYGDIVVAAIANVNGCYLKQMFEAEVYISSRLLEMAGVIDTKMQKSLTKVKNGEIVNNTNVKKSLTIMKNEEIVKKIEEEQGLRYSRLQADAIGFAATSGVAVITGGPGTGKTTTVRGVLKLFDTLGLKTSLCAPTGRAAKRLSELCGREAATIHRLLGATLDEKGEPAFERDENNPLKADAVIVDESSMIDIQLMFSLLKAMRHECRLVMIGDADQLPSVGPGNVFSDIIRSGAVPVIKLTEIFRQAQDSGIVKCAHNVNNGIIPDLTEKFPDLFFMRRQSEEQLAETVAELYSKRLPENMSIEASQIQVLTPTRKRASGTVALNELLREKLNPPVTGKKEKRLGEFVFRAGDKVMQIRNNYDIMWKSHDKLQSGAGVFNGDVGVIKDIDNDREAVTVDFDDKVVVYSFDQLPELEPAFAITVHKSQGSEYHAVILTMTSAAPLLLTRSVLYTAITRAKNLLVIVGNPDVMSKMIKNDKRQKRYSGLRARLAEH